jgi:hypothetical protein
MKNGCVSAAAAAVLIMLAAGCSMPAAGTDSSGGSGTGSTVEMSSSLFTEDSAVSGQTVFTTNDTAYISSEGYTLWSLDGSDGSGFDQYTVTVSKTSGNASAGYGLVFCETKDATYGVCMYCVLINITGQYAIGKIVNGSYSSIAWWTSSSHLKQGYVSNMLSVSRDSTGKKFTLYINGNRETEFSDGSTPVLESGSRGYVVVISPNEGFPDTYVTVYFSK